MTGGRHDAVELDRTRVSHLAGSAEVMEAVRAAPAGPSVAAIVDLDGALLSTDPLAPWLEPADTTSWLTGLVREAVGAGGPAHSIVGRVDAVVGAWAGREAQDVAAQARQAFRSGTAATVRTEVWRLLRAHLTRGHTVVLTSSATRFQIDPVAEELGAQEVHGTHVEVVDGVLTGHRPGPVLAGEARVEVVRKLAADHGFDLAESFAYVNPDRDGHGTGGPDDVGRDGLLELVGHPVAVAPTPAVNGPAPAGTVLLESPDRGTSKGPTEWASTAGFYGGFLGATGAGLGIGLLRRSRFQAWSSTCQIAADVSLGLAGIDVEVTGAEHVWSQRPAVFVFNHQGLIDPIVVMKLLQGGFTGVAKAETKNWPLFGQLFQLAGVAFVERDGAGSASVREALAPAVEKVRTERISLALAPEGTRSPTPTPGPFKKGAFHIAMQAGVPMVPIVLHNTGEVMWRKDLAMRPGTVRVDVLAPLDTSSWRPEKADEYVEHVRNLFLETLDGVPDPAAARRNDEVSR